MRKVIDIQMKFGEVDISKDDYYYPLQTLKDNLSLFTPEVLDRINRIVLQHGHQLIGKKKTKD